MTKVTKGRGREAKTGAVGDSRPTPGPGGDLRSIPGVGPATEADLLALGVGRVRDLVGQDPEVLFARLTAHQGGHTDRCNLYVYRCAVYFAQGGRDPRLLDWWRWKDAADPPLHLLAR